MSGSERRETEGEGGGGGGENLYSLFVCEITKLNFYDADKDIALRISTINDNLM